jgi:multidrug efflux pump
MQDVVGRLFHEFAITLAITIVLSAVVPLTLVPMMCALIMRHNPEASCGRISLAAERGFRHVIDGYDRTLQWVLNHQALVLILAIATLVLTSVQYIQIPKGFFPIQDTGAIQGITSAAQDVSFAEMARRQQALADVILKDKDVTSLSSFIGVDGVNAALNSGRMLIALKPRDERSETAVEIIRSSGHHDRDAAYPGPDHRQHGGQGAVPVLSRKPESVCVSDLGSPARGPHALDAGVRERVERSRAQRQAAQDDDRPGDGRALRHHAGEHRQRAL